MLLVSHSQFSSFWPLALPLSDTAFAGFTLSYPHPNRAIHPYPQVGFMSRHIQKKPHPILHQLQGNYHSIGYVQSAAKRKPLFLLYLNQKMRSLPPSFLPRILLSLQFRALSILAFQPCLSPSSSPLPQPGPSPGLVSTAQSTEAHMQPGPTRECTEV